MERVAIFAHFDRNNIVDKYILYYLQNLRSVSQYIVFVTTSKISSNDKDILKAFCDIVILRENIGYDFASWQKGLDSIVKLKDFDELILCNDSVYGPLYPLGNAFAIMGEKPCDFWGMTDNHEIAYHLQSYFLVFRKNIINSKVFKEFWSALEPKKTKRKIIEDYEIGLTQSLISAGFKPCVYASHKPSMVVFLKIMAISALRKPLRVIKVLRSKRLSYYKRENINVAHFFWKDIIVKHEVPFLKVELLRDNPSRINIKNYEDIIKAHSNYDVGMIRQHLERVKHKP